MKSSSSHSGFSLTAISVRRPVTTLMMTGIVVLLGWVSLTRLSVDLMPDMSFPTLSIVTTYEGAGPEEIETLLTRPIEQAVSSVAGADRITSESKEGSSVVRVRFGWGTNLESAQNEIRQQLDRIRRSLPDAIEAPFVRKFDIADSPIILMGLQSELSGVELTSLTERVILPRLEQIDGVARVALQGSEQREIQVQLDRAHMEARKIGVNEVLQALRSNNVMQPAGDLTRGDTRILVRNRGEFRDIQEIRETVIRNQAGAVVRIADIAEVVDGLRERTGLTRVNGQPALMVYIYKQAGANTILVSDQVHKTVATLNQELQEARLSIRQDKSDFIREAISNIQSSAFYGMLLAIVVLIIFLQNFRSTLIISLAMPLSVIATFALMYFQGFTLNIVSFGGLALGIGLLVDNSIVVLESIFHYREQGYDAKSAAIQGTEEVSGAIFASTLTTLIVFLPLIFVQGSTGVLLHQLAWVVSFSLLCSLLVSLTITPVMAAYWLPSFSAEDYEKNQLALQKWRRLNPVNWLHAFNRRILNLCEAFYQQVLQLALRFKFLTTAVLCLLLAVAAGLSPFIRTEFLPETDEGMVNVTMVMSPGITLERLNEQALEAERRILANTPEQVNVAGFIGGGADAAERWNRIFYRIRLTPRNQREASSEDVRQRLEKVLSGIPGCRLTVRVAQEQLLSQVVGQMGEGRLSVIVRGHDLQVMNTLALQVVDLMQSTPGFVNVEQAKNDAQPELGAIVDRPKASLLDVSVEEIGQVMETTLRGTEATVFRENGEEFPIMVRFREQDRLSREQLEQVSVTSQAGKLIPLKNLVHFQSGQAPLSISRLDQQRILVVSADLSGRELGQMVQVLNEQLQTLAVPTGYTLSISGDWEEQQRSFKDLQMSFLLALMLMYMVMASQFESLRDPLLIISSVPLAGIGVMVVLTWFNTTLNVQSFIGLIVLSGIIINNAIVVIDYTRQLKQKFPEKPAAELVKQACLRRFRPILMTTLTTVLAMLPVALGWGDGGELQAPMARIVIGGLLAGTLTTLIAIPLVYIAVSGQEAETNKAIVPTPLTSPLDSTSPPAPVEAV